MRIWGTGILNGMRIAMRNMFRGPITIQYPKHKMELPERARWAVAVKYDEEGVPKCTACMTCVKTCPDFVLDLQVTQDPETKNKHIDRFSYQVGACMFCGLCAESCPFDALEMSHVYELAKTGPEQLQYDLLTDVDAYKPKRPERPAPAEKPANAPEVPAAPAPEVSPGPANAPENAPVVEPAPAEFDASESEEAQPGE